MPVALSLPVRFRLGSAIASGGMGAVYEAEDSTLGRRVAIKVLAEHLAADPVYRARFAREARAAARVSSHPNIVSIYDVGEASERPYLVMELMEGGDLGAKLRRGRVAREDALDWLAGAAAGLDHGHAQGVVHRDVKPGNLLLDATGRVAVGDFGIAHLETEHTLTASGELLGTAAYLAPEQLLGERATARSDAYALAVVAFELLTGGRPFAGPHAAPAAGRPLEAPRASERAPDLPRGVDRVLARGLAADPQDRADSCGAFVGALVAALLEVDPPPAPVLVRRGRRRGPALLALTALLGLTGVLAALLIGRGGGDSVRTRAGRNATVSAPRPARTTAPRAGRTARSAPQTTPSTPDAPASSSAAALEARGHALLEGGQAAAAVPVLERALQATGETTDRCREPAGTCLTYAFALFDLGRALRLAGRENEAVPVLQDRLRIDNQRPAVVQELAAARGEAPAGQPASPPRKTKPAKPAKEHGRGEGG